MAKIIKMINDGHLDPKHHLYSYRQFQNVHSVHNLETLKWWLNSNQISVNQLSSQQRISLKIAPVVSMPPRVVIPDCPIGEVD